MELRPIKNERDHAAAMREIEKLWGAKRGTPEADRLEIWVMLVDAYEAKKHPIDPPDPIDAILFRLEQAGQPKSLLTEIIGSRARVSEILTRKRPLTLAMISRLRTGLGMSADSLIPQA
jgi:HTH-type transcriptional regulator/antitoxin HigA